MTTHDLTHINYKCISIMYKCLCEVCIANKINLSLKWCIPQNCKTHLTDTFNFFRLSCYLGEIKNLYFLSVSVCFIVLFCQHLVTERLLSREYLRIWTRNCETFVTDKEYLGHSVLDLFWQSEYHWLVYSV